MFMRITGIMNGRIAIRLKKERKRNAKEVSMTGWGSDIAPMGTKRGTRKRAEKLISRRNGFHLARSMKGHV